MRKQQDDGYDSPECDGLDEHTIPDELDSELARPAADALAELSNSWELASVVYFLGVFGVQLSLTDASKPVSLRDLASALSAQDAASHKLLADLHVGLLAGSNLTRSVPLDEKSWPAWLAKWVKRRNASAAEREGKPLSFFEATNLREDPNSICGANYNVLSPQERLELLHLLCCDRLENKRSLVAPSGRIDSGDAEMGEQGESACDREDLEEFDPTDAAAMGKEEHDGGCTASAAGSSGVPASWRPKPKLVDGKGRRYWYFSEAKGLQGCLFRSTRHQTSEGQLVSAVEEEALSKEEEDELWATCTCGNAGIGPVSSDDEEEEAEDKCQVCDTASDAQNLMLCDMCDEAYHTYCLRPVLKRVPPGEWACPRCDASGGTECPDKFVSPISRGLDKVSSFLAALAQAALGA